MACCSPCGSESKGCSQKKSLVAGAVGVVLVDGITCGTLCVLQSANSEKGSEFSAGVADVIVLNIVRLTLIAFFSGLGYWSWYRVQPDRLQVDRRNVTTPSGASASGRELSLLATSSAEPESLSGSVMFTQERLDEEQRRVKAAGKGELRRDVAVWAIFVVCSLCALYSGAKCVSFGTSNAFEQSGTLLTVLIGFGVFLCHTEFYIAKQCLVAWTTADGLNFPWLHAHTLHFDAKAECRMCQTCRSRILSSNHGGMAYFCPLCERHYYCIACLKRQVRQRQPALAAGSDGGVSDAGLHEAGKEQSSCAYMKRLLPLVRPFVHIVILSFVMVCVNQSFTIAQPHWQGMLLDAVAKGDSTTFQHAVVMYLVLNVGSGLFSSIQQSSVLLVRRRLAFRTRLMVFEHILKQDIAYFDANLSGQITSRLTNDAMQMTDPVQIIMNNLLSNLILLGGGLVMCFHTSWKLSILTMCAIFPITYLVRTYSTWAGKINRKINDEMSEANGTATQAIQNMRTVRYFGAEPFELHRYKDNLQNIYGLQTKDNIARIANSTLTNYLDLGVSVFVLWYGGAVIIAAEDGHFSLGQLITFQLYWNMMKNAFNGLNGVLSSLLRATASSQRILELLDLVPTITSGQRGSIDRADIIDGSICIENVSFQYAMKRSQKPVLDKITLKLPGGQCTALVGKSGSGKSTIASLLLRLYDPIDGRITLEGRDFRDFEPQSLRAQFGVVAQETQLFAGTVEDNIAYAMVDPYTKEDLELAASKANALEFIQKCDDGFETLVGDRGMLLSGGQKQRISIARMFLRKPRLLLLDEATSALDAENEALVQEALDGLVASGLCRTVVVIAHRLSTVRNADQIAVIEDGELRELGKHQELIDKDGIYAQLVLRQLHGKEDGKGGKKGRDDDKGGKKGGRDAGGGGALQN